MTEKEAKEFEQNPNFRAILRMRQWDEQAKDPNVAIESLEKYKKMCQEVLKVKWNTVSFCLFYMQSCHHLLNHHVKVSLFKGQMHHHDVSHFQPLISLNQSEAGLAVTS